MWSYFSWPYPTELAHSYAQPLFAAGKTIIDLSADFRLNSAQKYAQYYGQAHPAPDLLKSTPYVLPELAQQAGRQAN